MYLITENLKKNRYGGKYVCNVFLVNNRKDQPIDISEDVANAYDLKYRDGSIEIPSRNGTGVMVLTQLIKNSIPKANVYDVSVFNQ